MFRLLELRHPAWFIFDQLHDNFLALVSSADYSAELKKISKMVAVVASIAMHSENQIHFEAFGWSVIWSWWKLPLAYESNPSWQYIGKRNDKVKFWGFIYQIWLIGSKVMLQWIQKVMVESTRAELFKLWIVYQTLHRCHPPLVLVDLI